MKRYGIDLDLGSEELLRRLNVAAADLSHALHPHDVVLSGIYHAPSKGSRIVGFAIPELGSSPYRLLNAFRTHSAFREEHPTDGEMVDIRLFPEVILRPVSWEVGGRPYFTMEMMPKAFDKSLHNVFRARRDILNVIENPLYERVKTYRYFDEAREVVERLTRQGQRPTHADKILTGRVADFPQFTR